jgi:hypothetical protein
MPPPNRDNEHLAKLRDYYAEARRIPSQQRVAELVGFSKPAARKFLGKASGRSNSNRIGEPLVTGDARAREE